jgi:hypothetical protein
VRRFFLVTAAAVLAPLVFAAAGASKDGGVARLTTKLSLDAKPGSTAHVRWTVRVSDGKGGTMPFGASGMFVELLDRRGGGVATTGTGGSLGAYAADAKVPAGGIGGIRMGLYGWNDYGSAPMFFPLANDPFLSKGGVHCDVRAVGVAARRFVRKRSLRLAGFRFGGFDAASQRARFELTAMRGDDRLRGNGSLDCSKRPARIAALRFR